jgi:hypothetical protein
MVRLLDLLPTDAEHARKKRHLATALYGCTCRSDTCTHKRDIEEGVRNLILAGHLIVSSGAGYWRTDDLDEVERYIASLEHRRDSLTERVGALRKAVEARRSPVEQPSLWEDAA